MNEFSFVENDVVDLAVRIDKNEFRGEVKASVQIKDMRFSECVENAIKYINENNKKKNEGNLALFDDGCYRLAFFISRSSR